MTADRGDCEAGGAASAHPGRRVQPAVPAPTLAWAEADSRTNSPGENKKLLSDSEVPPGRPKRSIRAGLPLGVPCAAPRPPRPAKFDSATIKTKFQQRKEKLIKFLKPPYFVLSMILLMVCVHALCPPRERALLEWAPGAWWREPWRLLTYGVLHASTAHLALNAVVAIAVGWALEREQRWWRVVTVWAGGVAAGALGAGALQPRVHVVGASAAVYALLTSHLANLCHRYGHIPLWWFRPLSVVVLVSSELWWELKQADAAATASFEAHGRGSHDCHEYSYALRATSDSPQSHVAWASHALGALAGVPIAFLVYTGENSHKRYIWVLRVLSAALLLAGVALAAIFYTLYYEVLWVEPTDP